MPAATLKRKQGLSGPTLYREVRAQVANFDAETRRFDLSFASDDIKVRRTNYFDGPWDEVLGMEPDECDLTRLASGSAPLLWDHDAYDRDNLIGVVESASLKSGRGYATVRMSGREALTDLAQDVRDGIICNVSVGYQVFERLLTKDEGEDAVPEYRVTRWMPMEISLVAIPADDTVGVGRSEKHDANTRFTITNLDEDKPMPATSGQPAANNTTRAAGNNAAAATDDNASSQTLERPNGQTAVEGGERPATGTEGTREERAAPAPEVQTAVAAALRADRARTAAIRSLATDMGFDDAFVTRHAESSIEDVRADALVLLSTRSGGGQQAASIQVGTEEIEKRRGAAADWLLQRVGMQKDGDRVLNLNGNLYRGATLYDIAVDSLRRAGGDASGFDRMEIVGRAITHSTSDFAIVMGNVFTKVLLNAYSIIPDTWSQFSRVGTLPDFRVANRYRMGGFSNLDKIPEGGEYQYGTFADAEKNTIQLYTWGKMFSLTRQAIINDDLQALTDVVTAMGRAANRKIETEFYALLALNSGAGPTMGDGFALFSSQHGNLTSPGTAPSIASIALESQTMQQQTYNGDYVDVSPDRFLSGVALAEAVKVLNASQYDPATSTFQKPNQVRGLFGTIVGSPRAAAISATAWWVFANPEIEPVVEVAFLNGNRTPYTEQRQGWNVDGIEWKVRHDFGVGAVGWRGARKNPGA